MAKVLILYYSSSGNTEKMARLVGEGVKSEGLEAVVKKIEGVRPDEMLDVEGVIVGSPTYYGSMAAPIKQFFDDSVKFHGALEGKIGAAFSSSANIAGGNETTVLDILHALLIHGMIIQGDSRGDHYGPVAIGAPDNRSSKECRDLGARVARLVKRLAAKE